MAQIGIRFARLLGALAVLVSLGGALTSPVAAQESPGGVAALVDDQSVLDRAEVRISGLAVPPAGSVYRGWLASDDGTAVAYLGEVGFVGPTDGVLAFSQPAGETLFIQFSEVLVTLESGPAGAQPGTVALRGVVDPGALTHFRRLLVRWPDSRYGTASLQGMRQLSAAARFHAAVLREAAVNGDLVGMRRKAEHLVNLIEGSRGASFGDHDRDGRAEDPGDGVGLLPYAWGALTHTQFAWASAADEGVAEASLTVQPAVRFGLDWAGFVRDTGMELTRTQDAVRARELAGHLFTAVERVAAAVDPQTDPALRIVAGRLEWLPAYETALGLVQVPLLPAGAVAVGTAEGGS